MHELDVALTRWVNSLAGSITVLDQIMIWASAIGVPLMVLSVALQWWAREDRRHTRHVLVASGLTFILGLAINQVILLFIHRLRPYDGGITELIIAPSTDYSFPSDHATATFAIATAFLLHRMPRRGLVYLAAALLVTISRVYVGTHYVSDVAGGALTAVLAALVVRAAYREGTGLDAAITNIL